MNKQQQIEKYITDLIDQHMLKEGDRVFSLREMAAMHHTSITPVISAYEHLEMLGILRSRPKSGFFVAKQDTEKKIELPPFFKLFDLEDDKQAANLYRAYGLSRSSDICYPFALREFPDQLCDTSSLAACYKQILLQNQDNISVIGSNSPTRLLGEAIIQWSDRTKWLTDPSQICVTLGLTQALTLAMESSVTPRDTIAIEWPGNSYFYFAARLFGAQTVSIPSNVQDGLDLDALENALEQDPSIKCIMCMPNFSTPTGSMMPFPNKQRLISICEKNNIAIIEYDIAGNHSFKSQRPLPVKTCGSEQVIYISGYDHVTDLHYISGGKYQNSIRGFATLHQVYVPNWIQDSLAVYLMRPQSKRYLRKLQNDLSSAVNSLRAAIEHHFPEGTSVHMPSGGRFLWVELPGRFDSLELLNKALDYDISFSPGYVFSVGSDFSNCLRLNCAVVVGKPEMLDGIKKLGAILKEY